MRRAGRKAMPGHNVPMVVLGTFILAFGWFGFNPGSTLVGHRSAHQLRRCEHDARRHHRRARCLCLRSCHEGTQARSDDDVQRHARRFGCDHRALRIRRSRGRRRSLAWLPVSSWSYSVFFWEARGIDDPVGAISVHGVNGAVGRVVRRHICHRSIWRRLERRGARRDGEAVRFRRCARSCSMATSRSSSCR